jgi:hypothetical protein
MHERVANNVDAIFARSETQGYRSGGLITITPGQK